MKQAIEYLLFRSGVSNYQISKTTGISQPVLSKYTSGKSDIENMTFGNAIKLHNYFKEMVEMWKKEFGIAVVGGKEYILTQEAYIDGTHEHPYYRARALDDFGNEYFVYWDVLEGYEHNDDASNHCDWDKPAKVEEKYHDLYRNKDK